MDTDWIATAGAAIPLIILGALLSASILADWIAARTYLPRISLLVLTGLAYAVIQQLVLDIPDARPLGSLSEPLITLALVMVAFLLGGELTLTRLRRTGPAILALSLSVVLAGVATVLLGLGLAGYPLAIAATLAAISAATDPATVTEALEEGINDDERSRVIKGVVAIDDAWGILVFGLTMAALGWILATGSEYAFGHAMWELAGGVLLGLLLGTPAAWLTGRLRPGRPSQVEALALMLLIAGLSMLLGVSELLAAMVAGFVIVNLSPHHEYSFSEIEHIEWPFLVFFFVLAGASVQLDQVPVAAGLVLAYCLLRTLGRALGGWLGARWASRRDGKLPGSIGLALTPQAGVAMGLALLAAERFPGHGDMIVATVVTSTLLFELVGPFLVRWVFSGRRQTR